MNDRQTVARTLWNGKELGGWKLKRISRQPFPGEIKRSKTTGKCGIFPLCG
jgi:hypothetical protein